MKYHVATPLLQPEIFSFVLYCSIFQKRAVSLCVNRPSNGRRISCKKRESRTAFELRRQLNSHVGRRCAPDDRRMFRRPLNGRAASVQHSLNLHLCLCRRAKRRQSWRESCIKRELREQRPLKQLS